jgi:hypothetical protein
MLSCQSYINATFSSLKSGAWLTARSGATAQSLVKPLRPSIFVRRRLVCEKKGFIGISCRFLASAANDGSALSAIRWPSCRIACANAGLWRVSLADPSALTYVLVLRDWQRGSYGVLIDDWHWHCQKRSYCRNASQYVSCIVCLTYGPLTAAPS